MSGRAGQAVTHEFHVRRPSEGAIRWIRNTGIPLRDGQGRVQRVGGIAEDVTELRAGEAALRPTMIAPPLRGLRILAVEGEWRFA